MVKQPAAMSNQRARGLGSAIAWVAAAMPVFGTLDLGFLAAALLAFFFAVAFFFVAVFFATTLFVDAGLLVVVATSFGTGSNSMLADPGVGSNVQAHNPLSSAHACPVLAVLYKLVTSSTLPNGSSI